MVNMSPYFRDAASGAHPGYPPAPQGYYPPPAGRTLVLSLSVSAVVAVAVVVHIAPAPVFVAIFIVLGYAGCRRRIRGRSWCRRPCRRCSCCVTSST